MVEFFLARRTLHNLVKTKSIRVGALKGKDDIDETFPRYCVCNPLPFCGYHDHILCATDGYITQRLVLLYKVIKVIPDLGWLAFKPVSERS